MSEDNISLFSPRLLDWHKSLDRPLPWKGIKDPYLIWVSEIILQQTRAAQATPYYHKITERFPTVASLAAVPIDELLSMWQGLGYYSRARNLHFSAQIIMDNFGGEFPSNYKDIISLKGVGKYTAAAIGSFAFGLPHPVIDGNVIRVLSRYFDLDEPVDTSEGLNKINHLVQLVFNAKKPAKFNQAIMDFGATVCLPKKPACSSCPFTSFCQASLNNTQSLRPIKTKKLKRKQRNFNFLMISKGAKIYIQKRVEKDIWQELYQLPMIEGVAFSKKSKLEKEAIDKWGTAVELEPIFTHKQLLTHQSIHSIVWKASMAPKGFSIPEGKWVNKADLGDYGFPKTLALFLKDFLYIR